MEIIIDPRLRMNYASYYLKGIFEIFHNKSIYFSLKPFLEYDLVENQIDYNKGFCFIINKNSRAFKVYIDFDDSDTISIKHYEWADIYAKINLKKSDLDLFKKSMAIGPSFGINILDFNLLTKIVPALFFKKSKVPIKYYFRDYIYLLFRRRRYHEYLNSYSDKDYIFSISTLWYDDLTAMTTNRFRGEFLKKCKKIFPKFEGGFFYIKNKSVIKQFPTYKNYLNEYKGLIFTKRISPKEYIDKTKKSCLVFNTPSVSGCHGWKLGEYFAMGKAIVTTKINHLMPEKLSNEQLIQIDNLEELEDQLILLRENNDVRARLEKQSFIYFQKFLSPAAVINSIIHKINESSSDY